MPPPMGASALIYVDSGQLPNTFFQDKTELSPIQFPRFWLTREEARDMFGEYDQAPGGHVAGLVRLESDISWVESTVENVYGLVPGRNPKLAEELVIVEAFYDSTPLVAGLSPGADESLGAASLIELARFLAANPPERSVLLVGAAGHAQGLTGMREFIWSIGSRSRDFRQMKKQLSQEVDEAEAVLSMLKNYQIGSLVAPETESKIVAALSERIKTEVDIVLAGIDAAEAGGQGRGRSRADHRIGRPKAAPAPPGMAPGF